jgi:hypothetical protein
MVVVGIFLRRKWAAALEEVVVLYEGCFVTDRCADWEA